MPRLHDTIQMTNDIEILREILDEDDPNEHDEEHLTALHVAVEKIHSNPDEIDDILLVARELKRHGADVNEVDNLRRTPLHYAVMLRNCKMIEMLLQLKADVNKQDSLEEAPLHYAASRRMFEGSIYLTDDSVVALLLRYNAYVDKPDMLGRPPLMLATIDKNLYIVKILLRNNADATLKDKRENTAMYYALAPMEVNLEIVDELFRYGSSFATVNNFGYRPIHHIFPGVNRPPNYEIRTMKKVLKLYLFEREHSKAKIIRDIIESIKEVKPELTPFLKSCAKEIKLMWNEKIAPNVFVYQIAVRGAFHRFRNDANHFSIEIYAKMLEKLLKGQYPIYSDIIVAGICSPYMMQRLYEESDLSIALTGFSRDGARFDILCEISSFLSHFDILNAIKARRLERNVATWYTPRFTTNARCSVS